MLLISINCKKDKDNNPPIEAKELIDSLKADNAYIQGNYYYENNKTYKIEYKSDYDSVTIERIHGNNVIKFKVNPDTDYINERTEIRLAEMVPFSEEMKWVSIKYYATAPVHGIIFQCHQFPPNRPPIAIRSGDNGKLFLEIFNDNNLQTNTPIIYEIGRATINQWQNIIIGFRADPQGNGKVLVYLNQSVHPDVTFSGAVGFSFEQQFFDTIKFGIYRGRGKLTTDILYVDEIKYGTTLESIAG